LKSGIFEIFRESAIWSVAIHYE